VVNGLILVPDAEWPWSDEEPDDKQHGNRGLGGWQCRCGRFARFLRWQNTGAVGWERGYLVDCSRCGEVLVY
jgi:hypothetical protein